MGRVGGGGTGRRREAEDDVTALAPPKRKPSSALSSNRFLALAGGVVAAGVLLRLALLGTQSYWIDELYSVNESNGSFRQLLDLGSTEVHPPLYAVLLWGWIKIGGDSEAWTRLLSTLLAA